MKLTLILLLLITSLMAVVGAFLTTSVTSFYIDSFYQQMSSAFGADRREFVADLRSAAAQPDGAERIQEIMEVNAGMLGIDYRTRNYYVLDGTAGSFLAGSAESSDLPREQSANLLTARNAVSRKDASTVGDESDISADYMDVAIPIFGGDNAFIIYILDNKDTVSDLNNQLFQIIMQALIIGLLAGLICQIPLLNATPLLNIPSEILGALACGLLIKVPMSIGGKLDLNPLVNTFVSTVVSGGTFALLSVYINVVSTGGDVMVALATYAAIVFGTATFNCILVQVLAMPLKKVLKR